MTGAGPKSSLCVAAFDGSSPLASVALAREGVLLGEWASEGHRSASQLLAALDRLLHRESLEPANLDGVIAVAGPGSFSGTRVVLAIAWALVRAGVPHGRSLTTFEALAVAIGDRSESAVAAVPSVSGRAWWQLLVREAQGSLQPAGEVSEGSWEDLSRVPHPLWIASPPAGRAADPTNRNGIWSTGPLAGHLAREASRGSLAWSEPWWTPQATLPLPTSLRIPCGLDS